MKQRLTLLFAAVSLLAGTRAHAQQTDLTGTGYLNIGPQTPGGTAAGDATVGGSFILRNAQSQGYDWVFAKTPAGPNNVPHGLNLSFGYVGPNALPIKFMARGNWPYVLDVAIPGAATIGGTLYIGTQLTASSQPATPLNTLKLAVDGPIGARSAVYVRAPGVAWPDYVFAPAYPLRSLPETARYIQANGHLPDVPSAAEVAQNGLELAAMDALLLRKVEELTLHLIVLQGENETLTRRLRQLEAGAKSAATK